MRAEDFRFAPERASTAHVAGEGHAHLFIDGKKITRLYGEWYHVPALTPGVHKITVTLNANSHEDLTVQGKVVSDTKEEEPSTTTDPGQRRPQGQARNGGRATDPSPGSGGPACETVTFRPA